MARRYDKDELILVFIVVAASLIAVLILLIR